MPRNLMNIGPDLGSATMSDDGTIVLRLRPEGDGMMGDTEVTYSPDHEHYQQVFDRIGGLQPGQTKSVDPEAEPTE